MSQLEIIPGLAAIILCGGKSERMGFRKEWLTLEGETLLARLARELSSVADPIIVATGKESPVPPLPSSIMIVRDKDEERGPLAGMHAGFSALPPQVSRAFVISCDMPFMTSSIVRKLDAQLAEAWCVLPIYLDVPQPLCAIYRRESLPVIDELLNTARTGPRDLFARIPASLLGEDQIQSSDDERRALQSFNTPEEWAQIRMPSDI